MGIEKNPADFLPSDVEAVVAKVQSAIRATGNTFGWAAGCWQDSAFFHAEQTSVRQRVFY